jgi:hypothetical protein
MSKKLELFPTEAHMPTNMSAGIVAFTVRGVETKQQIMSNWVDVGCRHDLGKGERERWGRQRRKHRRVGEVGESQNSA